MRKVLVGTLGDSPGVVTEAIDKLKEEGIEIDEVVLLTTKDNDTKESAKLLSAHLPKYYENKLHVSDIRGVDTYFDIDSQESLLDFMQNACEVLRTLKKRNLGTYVCIAGGRKTMSALMALAVQIYGAKSLFHVISDDPDLEQKGKISELRNIRDERKINEILHPDPAIIKLVKLPFIGLFPWIGDIVDGLKGKNVKQDIKNVLKDNDLISDLGVTDTGKIVLNILESVESLPEPYQDEMKVRLSASEPKYKNEIQNMVEKIKRRFSFIKEISDIGWKQGVPKVIAKEGNILEVYFRNRKGFNLALRLVTTATTSGQLEKARQELEKFLEKEG
jgi:CRISPR-associated protein Csx14